MRTKLVYVLASTESDLFYEQCLISVYSAQLYNPNIKIVLVVDDKTHSTLKGNRKEITDYVDDIIVKDFPEEASMFLRSRLMKVGLRSFVKGDYLYVDCDTLIVDSLESIDSISGSVAAVLDGHVKLNNHPTCDLFRKQCDAIGFNLADTKDYFNGGVIFAKDDKESHNLYSLWRDYYLSGTSSNICMDQPSFNKANFENNSLIKELPGEWNCQVRFGAKYIGSAKVLHFCSKKNMPIASIASRDYLYKVKKHGLKAPDLEEKVRCWKNTLLDSTLCTYIDYSFVFSKEYENARKKFIQDSVENQIRQYRHLGTFYQITNSSVRLASLNVLYRSIRNSILGRISMKSLSSILFREKLGKEMPWDNPIDLNEKITWLAFNSDITIWSELADKYKVRKYIEDKGFGDYLPEIYSIWSEASQIDFRNLPQSFVLKCNHDNGSSIIVKDQYSIETKSIVSFFKKRLRKRYGLSTAEPHYQQISPVVVMAEELINNDSDYSDSIIDYKFFTFDGFAPYCQVVYNQKEYVEHVSDIYRTNPWCKYNEGNNSKFRSNIEVPRPRHLDEMLNMIRVIGKDIRFCRIDLYETKNKVYIGEITFMPGCGRISSFSQPFLNELGRLINLG